MNIDKMITGPQLRRYVADRGFNAEPLTNTIAAAEGAQLRVMGYRLIGPRGNKTTIAAYHRDLYSEDAVKLWCDGVDYATAKKKARARA